MKGLRHFFNSSHISTRINPAPKITSPFRRGVEVGGGCVLAAGGVCRCVRVGMRACVGGRFLRWSFTIGSTMCMYV